MPKPFCGQGHAERKIVPTLRQDSRYQDKNLISKDDFLRGTLIEEPFSAVSREMVQVWQGIFRRIGTVLPGT